MSYPNPNNQSSSFREIPQGQPSGRSNFNRSVSGSGSSRSPAGSYQNQSSRYGSSQPSANRWDSSAYEPLTETGFDFAFKRALLARYNPEAQLSSQAQAKFKAFSHASGGLLKDIWVPTSQLPLSLEPFGEEESKAVTTGHFCAPAGGPKRHHNQGGHQQYIRQQHQRQNAEPAQQQVYTRQHPASEPEPAWAKPPTQRESERAHHRPQEQPEQPLHDGHLWASRKAVTVESDRPQGTSSMATLRRKEMEASREREVILQERFSAPLTARKNAEQLKKAPAYTPKIVDNLSDLDDDDHEHLAAWAESSAPSVGHFDTRGKYVAISVPPAPQTLSAHHQGDYLDSFAPSLRQSLSERHQPVSPVLVTPTITEATRWVYRDPNGQTQGPFPNAKMLEWYNRSYFPDSLPLKREEDAQFDSLASWKLKCSMVPFLVPIQQPKVAMLDAPSATHSAGSRSADLFSSSMDLPAGDSPLSGFFDLQLNLPSRAPNLGPIASSPAGSKALSEEEASFLSRLGLGAAPTQGISAAPPATAHPKIGVELTPQPSWGNVQRPVPIDLAAESQSKPAQVQSKPVEMKQPPKAVPVQVAQAASPPVASPPAGWAKPKAQARPLEEILQEEERLAAAAPKQNPNAPKSFADLMKSVAASSPPASRSPTMVTSAPQAARPTAPRPGAQLASQPVDTREWCQRALAPLAPLYDVATCTTLLMDCANADDLVSFISANIRTERINVPEFTGELVKRRFGSAEAARIQQRSGAAKASSTAAQATEWSDVGDFVTVDRRSRKK